MRGFSEARLGVVLILLFSVSLCYGSDSSVEVVGFGECADCKENNIKTSHALSGLKVTIDCKLEDGKFKTRGVGKMNEEGQFKVSLPKEILKDGKLAEECYAQLHNAANAPCAVHSGLEGSKIAFQSKSNEKHTFGPTGKLKFSSAVCTSAFFWPIFKHPTIKKPSFPKGHPWLKKFGHVFPLPPKVLPPIPKMPFKKPCPPPVFVKPPPVPVYKPEPKPPVVEPPVYKPKPKPEPPVYKPKPEPPVYKPKPKPEPPVYKPHPKPPVYKPKPKPEPPVYKPKPKPEPPVYKPKPEPPVYKPKPKPEPPVYKPPTVPIYKPLPPHIPIYKPHPKIMPPPIPIYKPHPKILPPPIPIYKPIIPPFKKKPCPPISIPHFPPLPTLPPKKFHHPIIPLPPHH